MVWASLSEFEPNPGLGSGAVRECVSAYWECHLGAIAAWKHPVVLNRLQPHGGDGMAEVATSGKAG